jgi:hypothetical protein
MSEKVDDSNGRPLFQFRFIGHVIGSARVGFCCLLINHLTVYQHLYFGPDQSATLLRIGGRFLIQRSSGVRRIGESPSSTMWARRKWRMALVGHEPSGWERHFSPNDILSVAGA